MTHSLPTATYRLQLTPQFGFEAAAAIVPYLKSLGISHLYSSPFFAARPGTTHGYDIIDHTAFNPELGGEVGFLRLSEALTSAGMGLIVDFVPNHMCVEGVRNDWWWNALEFGPHGRHAAHFDIAWDALPGRPRVLLPVLGKSYGECLEAGELQLMYEEGSFSVGYFGHRFPIRPDSYRAILRTMLAGISDPVGPSLDEVVARGFDERMTEERAQAMKQSLAAIRGIADIVARRLDVFDARAGALERERLHRLLDGQHYRLAFWRVAGSEINYRRFFDISSLAGLRVERRETFDAIHPLIARLLREGRLQGLRIDHIDGLYDPAEYCARLQRLCQDCAGRRSPTYIVVEKILAEGEELPDWPGVAGTTGYEWMNALSRMSLKAPGLAGLTRFWRELSPAALPFEDTLRRAKSQILDTLFAGEFDLLARLLTRIARGHYSSRDYSADRLRRALRAYVVEFPVYRTYAANGSLSDADHSVIGKTIGAARSRLPTPDGSVFDFLQRVLTLELARHRGQNAARIRRFVMKLQQLTGPVMAKSLEDTALYRDHRLLALNEVGNEPTLPPLSVDDFHARVRARAARKDTGLTATATHDTKRGEDARMRILALADLADEWFELVREWRGLNDKHVKTLDRRRAPSVEHEYMIYQAMIGLWPVQEETSSDLADRLCAYAVKAAREGKVESSWLQPDAAYEQALGDFIRNLLDRARSADFLRSFEKIAPRCALLGALHSLSQLALKMTMPGVPDIYQGNEFWDLSLVDPDNRRPVDFAVRAQALASLDDAPDWSELADRWQDGEIKLALTRRLLRIRQSHRKLFAEGSYSPIDLDTADFLAFTRSLGEQTIIVLVGRSFGESSELGRRWPGPKDWSEAVAPLGQAGARNLLGGALGTHDGRSSEFPVGALLGHLPVAVLQLQTERNVLLSAGSQVRGSL